MKPNCRNSSTFRNIFAFCLASSHKKGKLISDWRSKANSRIEFSSSLWSSSWFSKEEIESYYWLSASRVYSCFFSLTPSFCGFESGAAAPALRTLAWVSETTDISVFHKANHQFKFLPFGGFGLWFSFFLRFNPFLLVFQLTASQLKFSFRDQNSFAFISTLFRLYSRPVAQIVFCLLEYFSRIPNSWWASKNDPNRSDVSFQMEISHLAFR